MSVTAIEDIISEARQRDEWKKKLAQLDEIRVERLERIEAAIQDLRRMISNEGHVSPPECRAQFANKLTAMYTVLHDNGVGRSIEEASQRGRRSGNLNLQLAAVLLAQKSEQEVIDCLDHIHDLRPFCDPTDPAQACQSEIFRHFLGLLWNLVKVADLPEHPESMELLGKLLGKVGMDSRESALMSADADGGTRSKRSALTESSNQMVVRAEQKIREAIGRDPKLKTAKTAVVIKAAQVRNQVGLAALHRLKRSGEYRGPKADEDN